jgi:hypothetical protein
MFGGGWAVLPGETEGAAARAGPGLGAANRSRALVSRGKPKKKSPNESGLGWFKGQWQASLSTPQRRDAVSQFFICSEFAGEVADFAAPGREVSWPGLGQFQLMRCAVQAVCFGRGVVKADACCENEAFFAFRAFVLVALVF